MLLEGTNLRDEHSPGESLTSESAVETDLAATLRNANGLVVVLSSPQNIDRMVTVYRAALRADRDTAIDLYGAEVAVATGRDTIPRPAPDWPRVRVYMPVRQRVRVKESGEFHRTEAVRAHRIFDEDLAASPGSWVLCGAYQWHVPAMIRAGLLDGGVVVWSMWDGYLVEPSGQRFTALLAEHGVPMHHHHTSGHAAPADLQALIAAVQPATLVPIHTDAPHRYAEVLGYTATLHDDGAWWTV
ncbi:MBL fold metallo-hydrolase RNA specificity domain-containing protein [Luedemannella flava]